MANPILLSAGLDNIEQCIDLAVEKGLGIEVMAFAFPQVLDGNWNDVLSMYRGMLRIVPGKITLHGPFMDMVSGSPDNRINEICSERYQHAIRIASELHAEIVVFHANFIGSLHNPEYRVGWHDRNLGFWEPIGDYAKEYGVTVAIENMWEFDPYIIGNLLKDLDHPNLRTCLDVGHAHLFSDENVKFDTWLETMQPWLVHCHINNNDGKLDIHSALPKGVLDYKKLLPKLFALPEQPSITLEMYKVEDMRASLPFFEVKDEPHKQPLPEKS